MRMQKKFKNWTNLDEFHLSLPYTFITLSLADIDDFNSDFFIGLQKGIKGTFPSVSADFFD